jgi:steroid delta-isomerase
MDDIVLSAVEKYFETLGAADQEPFVAQFSHDVVLVDPVGTPVLEGHSGVAKFHKGVARAWKQLRLVPERSFIREDRAAVYWQAEGESSSGKRIQFDGINTFSVNDNGEICRLEGFWDIEGVIAQM